MIPTAPLEMTSVPAPTLTPFVFRVALYRPCDSGCVETVQLPEDNDIEQALAAVPNPVLNFRAVVGFGGTDPVGVVAEDGDLVPLDHSRMQIGLLPFQRP